MIFALVLAGVGLLFTWLAILGWRCRGEESISLLEAAILIATSEEPLPLTRFDRWLQKFQLAMMSLFGPALIVLGIFGFCSELGLL